MKPRSYRVLIVGAGIAGLTAAIALRRAGHDVRVFERQPQLQAVGAGLILWSNAITALRALDLEETMRDIGYPLERLSILDPDGTVLAAMDAQRAGEQIGAPTLAVHRGELMDALHQDLPNGTVRFGREFAGFETLSGVVIARFADGTEEIGDVLLGADGLNSTVRAQLHGEEPPRYAGYTAWRGVVDWQRPTTDQTARSTETWGRGRRFGWVPMSRNRVYWFATKNAPKDEPPDDRGHKAELVDLFSDWHPPIPETIADSDETGITRHDIYDRPPIADWGTGQVTLSGDAAHPTTPNLGQGAAMGIEDAVVLAGCLGRYATIDAALRAYAAQRHPRTSQITRLSYQMGLIAQMTHPRLVPIRDAVIRAVPNALTQRQLVGTVNWTPPGLVQLHR